MKKKITGILFIAFLLSGCSANSTESKSAYDELELLRYKVCIEKMVEHMHKQPTAENSYTYSMVQTAEKYCKPVEPTKK